MPKRSPRLARLDAAAARLGHLVEEYHLWRAELPPGRLARPQAAAVDELARTMELVATFAWALAPWTEIPF